MEISNALRFNFYPCYERFCRRCIDGTCTDEETYKNCEFGADKVMKRARKNAMETLKCLRCSFREDTKEISEEELIRVLTEE